MKMKRKCILYISLILIKKKNQTLGKDTLKANNSNYGFLIFFVRELIIYWKIIQNNTK